MRTEAGSLIKKQTQMKFLIITAWVILTILIADLSFMLVSLSDTILNIVGALTLCIWAVLSYYTRCLTKILTLIKTKKDEKNN